MVDKWGADGKGVSMWLPFASHSFLSPLGVWPGQLTRVRPPTAHNGMEMERGLPSGHNGMCDRPRRTMSTVEAELRQKSEELEAQVAHMSTAEAKLRQKSEELEAQVAHTSAKEAESRQLYEKLAEELAEAQKEGEDDE